MKHACRSSPYIIDRFARTSSADISGFMTISCRGDIPEWIALVQHCTAFVSRHYRNHSDGQGQGQGHGIIGITIDQWLLIYSKYEDL